QFGSQGAVVAPTLHDGRLGAHQRDERSGIRRDLDVDPDAVASEGVGQNLAVACIGDETHALLVSQHPHRRDQLALRAEQEGAPDGSGLLGFDVLGDEALEERDGVRPGEPDQFVQPIHPALFVAGGPVFGGDVAVGLREIRHIDLARAMAARAAAALSMVSRYSEAGSESATIPAPAWIQAVSPACTTVRRHIAVSTLPEKSM